MAFLPSLSICLPCNGNWYELARNYAYTCAEKYYGGNILWMNAEEEEVLARSFRELAKNKLEIRTIDANGQEKDIKDVVDDVYHYFRSMKSLFIFDNVDNYKSIKKFLPFELLLGDNIPCVLVTSCNREWKTEKNVSIQMQYLGGFSVKEAEEFIRKALDISDRSQSDEVGRLAKNEQYFPLALQEAVSYINRRRLVTKDFWIEGYLKEYAKEAELLNSSNFQRIEASSITLKITLNRIGKNEDCGRKALEILNIMAYFAANNLPSAIFFLGLTEDQKELTSEAIKLLCQYSVISINVDNILGIHRLAQKMIRLELKEKKMEVEVLKQAFKLLKKTFSDSTRNIYKIDCLLLEHLQVFRSYICNLLKENGVDKKNIEKTYLKDLLIWEAQIYGQYRDIQKQKNLLKEALFISPEDPIIKAKLAVVFENLGDYKEQKEYLEQALFVFKKTGEQDDLQIAIIEAKLGRAYGNLGQYDEQKEYLERALDVFEKLDKQDDLRVATVKLELGKAYGNLRQYNKKKEYLEQALGVFDKRYSPEFSEFQYYSIFWKYPVFLWTKYGLNYDLLEGYHLFSALQMIDLKVELSRAYESLGEYEKQNKCLYDVLLSFKKYYVFNDLRVAIIELEMARSYGNLGLRLQQVGCLKFVKEVFIKRHVQEINPFQVAIVKLELGRAYRSLGMYDEQKNELEQALDLCEKYQDIDALQVAFIKAELGAISAYFDGKRDYLEQALDIFEEYYYHDDRGAIDELKKKLYGDKFQLNRDEKLSALKRQRRLLEKQFPVLKNFREGDNVPISSGSVELDEAYEKSLKYGALQYAITLKSIAKIKRDTNMESNKKNSFAPYIMMMKVAKAVLKKYYGVCHFYYAVTTIRLSVYNSEFQHISFLSEEDFVEALDVLKLHYNYLSEHADMPVRLPELNFMHQKSEVSVEECLPNTSYRKKREAESECLFTWKDVDEFNEEKDEIRDLSKIKIDSKKFIRYLKNLPEEKRSQLIKLASEVKIGDNSQGLMSKLISNQKVMNHLGRVGKISGMTMHGMMAKNVLADFLNGDYKGVAINIGFIAGGQGFAKVAEIASLKGLKLASEGKLLLGRSLKAASPFLAHGTSAFVVYDLVNQIKAFKNGTEEALVGVVGDSIYLGVDAAEIGIEIAEAFEVLEGVSSVTGPIGAAVGAVVFIGTDIYMAVKRVDKIDEIVHLTGGEKIIEGLRAFVGMKPEQYIGELMGEKQVNDQLVKQGLEYLKQHNDTQRYVFPAVNVKEECKRVPSLQGARYGLREEKCRYSKTVDLNNTVLLDRKVNGIKWSRAKPDNPNGGEIFCFPQGDYQPASNYGLSLCRNAIGITDLSTEKRENYTLINLGEGHDFSRGFLNSPNIFVVGNGFKKYYGGNKDDIFILQGNFIEGHINGGNGVDTVELEKFASDVKSIQARLGRNGYISYNNSCFGMENINRISGRKNKSDIITCDYNTKYVDGRGGENDADPDVIIIPSNSNFHEMHLIVRSSTSIVNHANIGSFNYTILPERGKGQVSITLPSLLIGLPTDKHNFFFNFTISKLVGIYIQNFSQIFNYTVKSATFSFLSADNKAESAFDSQLNKGRFNITISDIPVNASYILSNGAQIKMGRKSNMYMLESSNKSSEEIIRDYLPIANRVNKMSFFIQSLLSNETVVIGSGNHEVVHSNPGYRSHLVGNGGENVYVIDSKTKEVIIHDVDEENSIDTIDLRNVVRKAKEVKVIKLENDLLLRATVKEQAEHYTVRLKDGVERYNKTHVIVENVPMRISFDNNEWSLKPQSLMFEKDKEIILVTGQDVEEGNEIITPRKGGNYKFVRSNGNDLMITNAFDLTITKNDLCTIIMSKFYEEPKMATLSVKFADKEIILKEHQEEISSARNVNVVKKEHEDQVYNDVFNHTKSSPEVIDQPVTHRHRHSRHREQARHRRSTKSSSTRPTGWINDLFCWVKSSVSGLLSSKPESTPSLISQVDARVDVNGTIMLLDVFIRKVTGQKYISTVDQSISPLEAQGYALNITKGFEKVVEQAGLKSGVSMHRLNIDYMGMQKEITRKVMSGKFNEISGILKSYVEKACPGEEAGKLSPKKFDKFIAQFNKGLLNQSIEQILYNRDGTLEVYGAKQMSLEPQSYLSNASVHSLLRSINLSF